MQTYVIERDLPGFGNLWPEELTAVARKSSDMVKSMAPDILWVQSYVTENKVYRIYVARDEGTIREHGRRGDFPITRISALSTVSGPAAK